MHNIRTWRQLLHSFKEWTERPCVVSRSLRNCLKLPLLILIILYLHELKPLGLMLILETSRASSSMAALQLLWSKIHTILQPSSLGYFALAKCHCKLSPIEPVWAQSKWYTKAYCNYSVMSLWKLIIAALEAVTLENYFRKVQHNVCITWKGFQVVTPQDAA